MPSNEKRADAAIDERLALRIGDIAQRVGPIFRIVRKPRIGGSSDVAGGEVGKKRGLGPPAVTGAGIALRPSPGQIRSLVFLRGELRFSCEHRVGLRGK